MHPHAGTELLAIHPPEAPDPKVSLDQAAPVTCRRLGSLSLPLGEAAPCLRSRRHTRGRIHRPLRLACPGAKRACYVPGRSACLASTHGVDFDVLVPNDGTAHLLSAFGRVLWSRVAAR